MLFKGNAASTRPEDVTFRKLLEPLPSFARDRFIERNQLVDIPPQDVEALFRDLDSAISGAGIAEGRGGYPGGKVPGWYNYVSEQFLHFAIYDALIHAYGEQPKRPAKDYADYAAAIAEQVIALARR